MSALPNYPEALAAALGGVKHVNDTERVPLDSCVECSLAEEVRADRDLPPFDRAQMDGYALRAKEYQKGKPMRVVYGVAAGQPAGGDVPADCCVAVATGAPLPAGLDTVIQHELSDRRNPVRFTEDQIKPGHAVHRRATDAHAGAPLLTPPLLIRPHHLGIAAMAGKSQLNVHTPPTAVVMTSGDEVVPADRPPLAHQIRNSNAPMIRALLVRFGARPIEHQHVADDLEETCAAVLAGVQNAKLLVTLGGVSAGERDHFPEAFRRANVRTLVKGANIQPGRPIFVGCTNGGCVVVGLPGNPVSALATSCLFVWPIVLTMLGMQGALPWRTMQLAETVRPNAQRRAFRPAVCERETTIRVPDWGGSGDLAHTGPTHGLAELPAQNEALIAGREVRFLPWP